MFTKFHTAFSVTVGCDGELFTVLKTYLKIDKKIFNKLKTQLPVSGHCSRGLPVLQKKLTVINLYCIWFMNINEMQGNSLLSFFNMCQAVCQPNQ